MLKAPVGVTDAHMYKSLQYIILVRVSKGLFELNSFYSNTLYGNEA